MKKLQLSIYYLQELNYRLAYTAFGTALSFFTTYTYKQGLIFSIIPKGLSHFVSSGLTEVFFTYIELCAIICLNQGILLVILQSYLFLRPGLYTYEAKTIFNLLIAGICFYAFIYLFVFPLILNLLWELFSAYSQNFTPIHLTFEPRINDYLRHIHQLNKILIFSFPCVIALNLSQKYTDKKKWTKYRGLSYIIAFFIAAFITPPDVLSQTLVGIPLIILFEMQIIFWTFYKEYQKKLLKRQPIKCQKYSEIKE